MDSKKKGNLWVFGDSFSSYNGIFPGPYGDPYYEYKTDKNDNPWFVHLKKKLDLSLINKGHGGYSNDHIFDIIIENINKIKREDVVIICTSFNDRIYIPNKHVDYPLVLQMAPDDIEKDVVKLLERYCAMFCEYDFKQRSAFSKQTEKRFKFLKDVMDNYIGVKSCVVWSVYLFNEFESITTATNKKIEDLHWSYKGHYDFFKYIRKEYEKNINSKR